MFETCPAHKSLSSEPSHPLFLFFSSLLASHNLTRELGPGPNLRSIKHKHPRNNGQQRPNPTQQRTRLRKPQIFEQRRRHKREHTAEHIPTAALRRQRTARVAMICVCEIIEGREVDGIDPHCSAADCERWDDPRYGVELGPSEPEKANGKQRTLYASEIQPPLWTIDI